MRFVLILLLLLFASSCTQQSDKVDPVDQTVHVPWNAEKVQVDEVDVLEPCAHEYDLQLEDGRRIKGVLKVTTPKEAHEKVVKLINTSVGHPKAVLYKDIGSVWQVDLILTVPECEDEEGCALIEISITEWLRANNLAWD